MKKQIALPEQLIGPVTASIMQYDIGKIQVRRNGQPCCLVGHIEAQAVDEEDEHDEMLAEAAYKIALKSIKPEIDTNDSCLLGIWHDDLLDTLFGEKPPYTGARAQLQPNDMISGPRYFEKIEFVAAEISS